MCRVRYYASSLAHPLPITWLLGLGLGMALATSRCAHLVLAILALGIRSRLSILHELFNDGVSTFGPRESLVRLERRRDDFAELCGDGGWTVR